MRRGHCQPRRKRTDFRGQERAALEGELRSLVETKILRIRKFAEVHQPSMKYSLCCSTVGANQSLLPLR